MDTTVKISKWGNSCGIRIPSQILKEADMGLYDTVFIESDQKGKITIVKNPRPKKGTLEYLFKDYGGEQFKTKLIDLGDSVGEEKW